jgi:hypothetical protein
MVVRHHPLIAMGLWIDQSPGIGLFHRLERRQPGFGIGIVDRGSSSFQPGPAILWKYGSHHRLIHVTSQNGEDGRLHCRVVRAAGDFAFRCIGVYKMDHNAYAASDVAFSGSIS